MITSIEQEYYPSAVRALFLSPVGHRAPAWLQAQAVSCAQHYDKSKVSREFESVLAQFSARGQQPFEIFVVGEGNFGKSTLVNALLGHKISSVDFRPETRSFLRYVLKRQPASHCDVYARLLPGMHEHLMRTLGKGEVNDLFNTTRHCLSNQKCDEILVAEADRCRLAARSGERYTPAILEVERELPWTDSCLFPEGVRLVDTQGLNQIFDDDLLTRAATTDEITSTKLFENWMASSPRAKHLDWQFRRCDAVLWLVSAQKPNPGATRAAFRYLSKYGKATVVAITQVDRVQGGNAAVDEVLKEVRRHFGGYARSLVPINARKAMESSLIGDLSGIADSGLGRLVTELAEVCLQDASLVRGKSQYLALRATEDQMRTASLAMVDALQSIESRLSAWRNLISKNADEQKEAGVKAVRSKSTLQLATLQSRIASIGLMDDSASALAKLRTSAARAEIHNAIDAGSIICEAALAKTIELVQQERFELPGFDADGKCHGVTATSAVNIKMSKLLAPELDLYLSISERPIKAMKIWALKMLPFGLGDGAIEEERVLNAERHNEVGQSLIRSWSRFEDSSCATLSEAIDKAFLSLSTALDDVEQELVLQRGEALATTRQRLETTLATRCVVLPFIVALVAAFRGVVGAPLRLAQEIRQPTTAITR